jgi:C-terminal processing protease CtpA/Prc
MVRRHFFVLFFVSFEYISGVGIYYPDGTQTQRIGIMPDILIEPTIEGIRQGRDELLEKAIELINGEL